MSILFCTVCGHRMTSDSPFCEECGTPVSAKSAAKLCIPPPTQVSRLSTFFASQATLCLFTLLIFLGLVVALAPAGWRYAGLQIQSRIGQNSATNDSRSVGTSNAPARCNQIVVLFAGTATVTRVSALLEQLDTTIAFGPNENGAFELSTPSASATGVADALNRASDAVVSASLRRRCL